MEKGSDDEMNTTTSHENRIAGIVGRGWGIIAPPLRVGIYRVDRPAGGGITERQWARHVAPEPFRGAVRDQIGITGLGSQGTISFDALEAPPMEQQFPIVEILLWIQRQPFLRIRRRRDRESRIR